MVKWINYIELEEPLDLIEERLGSKLPYDLKQVIQKNNKGMPRPNKIPLGNEKFAEFDRLISFNSNESFTVYSSMTEKMKTNNIIPFGTTTNGNFICLKQKTVILYNIEREVEKKICSTVTELLNMLC